MLNNLDYSRVLYYPAGGTDIQAILRFSNVVDTILSPTVSKYLTKNRYEDLFRTKCDTLNSHFGESLLEFVGTEEIDASIVRNHRFAECPLNLFSKPEEKQYMGAFRTYMDTDPKLFKFKFRRKIKRSGTSQVKLKSKSEVPMPWSKN